MQNNANQEAPVLQGGVEYIDYKPYLEDFKNKLSDNIKKNIVNKSLTSNIMTAPLYLNPASRAYLYNAAGVNEMNNSDFFPWEIESAKRALANRLSEKGGRFDKPIDVKPHNYEGHVADTSGNNYIKNFFINPMRMTTGHMWVAPEGKLLHPINNNFYEGDPYDFSPIVQNNPDFTDLYQRLQSFGTNIRNNNTPMILNLNLKDKQ